jgi:hypothetical protein
MNNSFARLIDGMCATLRAEVLTRLDDEFARGQVFGVINLLNTFKVRADWSAGFLIQQIEAQRIALEGVAASIAAHPAAATAPALAVPVSATAMPISELLARRDEGNRRIVSLLDWLDAEGAELGKERVAQMEGLLRAAMHAEVDIELKHSPRPLFAEMSSGSEA